jgi:hypothetical protein
VKKFFKNINEKLKKIARWFFVETKIGIWIMKWMAVLNGIEGFVHLVVAVIGTWGIIDTGVYDARIWLPVIENFVLGAFSLLTAWALGFVHHHH